MISYAIIDIEYTSLELWIVLLEVFLSEAHHSYYTLLTSWNKSSAVSEEFNRIDGPIVATNFSHFVSMNNIADMSLESSVTSGHCSHDSRDTSTHDCVELGLDLITKQGRNWNCIHRQLLLEVPQNLKCLGINDLGSILSCSG